MLHRRPRVAPRRALPSQCSIYQGQQHVTISHISQRLTATSDLAPHPAQLRRAWPGIKQVEHLLQPPAGHAHVMDRVRIVPLQDLGFVRHEAIELAHCQIPHFFAALFIRKQQWAVARYRFCRGLRFGRCGRLVVSQLIVHLTSLKHVGPKVHAALRLLQNIQCGRHRDCQVTQLSQGVHSLPREGGSYNSLVSLIGPARLWPPLGVQHGGKPRKRGKPDLQTHGYTSH